jgi:hypothetical protein
VDADVPLRVVSDLSGHSTVKLLADRYSHVLPAHLRQSAGGGGEAGETRTEHGEPEQGCDGSDGPGFG